jgi:hypothetical protein
VTKKQYFLIVDSETTIKDHVADFGAAVVTREGEIVNSCGILVNGIFDVEPLFYDVNSSGIWAKKNLTRRTENYRNMLESGSRIIASIGAINRWLDKVNAKYKPELTAYNLAFDANKCANTGIDLTGFQNRFCLWHAAAGNICLSREYRKFVLENHLFNPPTAKGNMTFRTDAEAVAGFLTGQMSDEPHTALEDITGFEIPVLTRVIRRKSWRENSIAYNWMRFQVRKHFKAG